MYLIFYKINFQIQHSIDIKQNNTVLMEKEICIKL